MTRKVFYLTGTRADFGLMEETLKYINCSTNIDLSLIVTGTHLNRNFGYSFNEIKETKIKVIKKIYLKNIHSNNPLSMTNNISLLVRNLSTFFYKNKPDILILLGDRGEMLAGAISALHHNIIIVHIHGGERSGTIDESVRHSISKLSHYHFVSTNESKNRLIKMGEFKKNIFVTGAPGISDIKNKFIINKENLFKKLKLNKNIKTIILIYHPVVQESSNSASEILKILPILIKNNFQILAFEPNSDVGSKEIINALLKYQKYNNLKVVKNINRNLFLSLMKNADLMIGNSSSGIIEAASFNLPVINIGSRQFLRERNSNIFDYNFRKNISNFEKLIFKLIQKGKMPYKNKYYRPYTQSKITKLLESLSISSNILNKINAY